MRRLFIALPIIVFGAAASAQTIDQQGATQLSDALAAYVSRDAFDKGILKVSPDGDAYKMEFDFKALAGLFPVQDGMQFEIAPYSVRLKPQAGGTWQVDGDLMPSGSFKATEGNVSIDWQAVNGKMSGLYDPALPAFSTATGSFDTMTVKSSNDGQKDDTTYTGGAITMSAAKSATGAGVDYTSRYTVREFEQVASFKVSADQPDFPVTIKVAGLVNDMTGKGVNAQSMLDLLAFGVANPDAEKIEANQAQLKSLLLAALPLWNGVDGGYSFDSLNVTTPAGIFKTGRSSASMTMTGLSDRTAMSYGMQLSGIEIQSLFKPAWMTAVTPKEADIGFSIGVFRSDYWARKILEAMDLTKTPPLPESFGEQILAELAASPPKLTLTRSVIRNDDVEIAFDGEMTLAEKPVGSFDIEAKGFEKIVEALALAAASDPSAEQMVQGAQFLQAYAKPGADGGLLWTVKMQPDGAIFLNELPVKPADPMP